MQKTSYFSLFYANKKNVLLLGKHTFQMHKHDLIITRQNIPVSFDKESITAFFFDKEYFYDLFMSQIGDCRIIYVFFNLETCRQEYLFFRTSKQEDIQHYMFLLNKQFKEKGFQRDKLVHLLLVGLLTTLDTYRQTCLIIQKICHLIILADINCNVSFSVDFYFMAGAFG